MTAGAPGPVSAPATEPLPVAAPAIELRDVTRSFPGPPEVQALKGVNVSIADGEYVSITGPSGSGKSTMLNILGLLDRPTVGEYRLGGVLTGVLDEDKRAAVRARHLGFVFQAFHLMSRRTALQNVLLPMLYNGTPRAEREPRAREALERVGLRHRTDFLPGTLSGGERQRVAVARAVASRPRVLLADEPTGNLDSATGAEITGLLSGLADDHTTVVLITHNADVAAAMGRQVHLRDGRIVDDTRAAPAAYRIGVR